MQLYYEISRLFKNILLTKGGGILKIDVEVVTGFLGYGKTSFINALLKESQVDGERVLIIQMEYGNKKIYEINDINYHFAKAYHLLNMLLQNHNLSNYRDRLASVV